MGRKRPSERLRRLIQQYKLLERSADPFSIDVRYFVKVMRECFPRLQSIPELCLDGEAIDAASSVLALQVRYLEYMTALLYRDPLLVQRRLSELDKADIAHLFLKNWHPLIAVEQMTAHALASAADYWEGLLPLSERLAAALGPRPETRAISRSELLRMGILTDKSFMELVKEVWGELKEAGETDYWDFIVAPTYERTLQRAILVSFLVTYGYAMLKVDHIEGKMTLIPYERRRTLTKRHISSIPISIAEDRWRRAVEEKG
ncbi:TPA: hypothetical protein EYP44_00570 [Candidatus Bathyarchaeota archaeon]|nr:hypothetical protein [Candidatus Bathyarchaeota archaeon]